MRKLVILESPYAGDREINIAYAKRCMLDSIQRYMEAPMLSHLLYTQALDDNNPEQRAMGINCGMAWMEVSDYTVVYKDYGLTLGMRYGVVQAIRAGKDVIERRIGKNPCLNHPIQAANCPILFDSGRS